MFRRFTTSLTRSITISLPQASKKRKGKPLSEKQSTFLRSMLQKANSTSTEVRKRSPLLDKGTTEEVSRRMDVRIGTEVVSVNVQEIWRGVRDPPFTPVPGELETILQLKKLLGKACGNTLIEETVGYYCAACGHRLFDPFKDFADEEDLGFHPGGWPILVVEDTPSTIRVVSRDHSKTCSPNRVSRRNSSDCSGELGENKGSDPIRGDFNERYATGKPPKPSLKLETEAKTHLSIVAGARANVASEASMGEKWIIPGFGVSRGKVGMSLQANRHRSAQVLEGECSECTLPVCEVHEKGTRLVIFPSSVICKIGD